MKEAKENQKEKNERGGEKMENSIKSKRQKGITLIALVITIIVLLILAAVSIATLTGENGILSKANTAKEETQREDAKEQAKLDIATYVTDDLANGGDGSITNEIIKGILTGKDYVEGEPRADSFKSKNGQEIPYSELYGNIDGAGGEPNVTFNPDDSETPAEIPEKYGYKVEPKDAQTKLADGTWRLFYQDKNYTYIISDALISLDKTLQESYNEKYGDGSGASVSKVGQNLNPMLKRETNKDGNEFFSGDNKYDNIKAVAWLTDTEVWKQYAPETSGALFAIAGPTMELFRASFNAAIPNNKEVTKETEIPEIAPFGIGDYGYKETQSTKDDNFKTTYSHGIYRKGNSDVYWWLASPSSSPSKYLWTVSGYYRFFCQRRVWWHFRFGPPFGLFPKIYIPR